MALGAFSVEMMIFSMAQVSLLLALTKKQIAKCIQIAYMPQLPFDRPFALRFRGRRRRGAATLATQFLAYFLRSAKGEFDVICGCGAIWRSRRRFAAAKNRIDGHEQPGNRFMQSPEMPAKAHARRIADRRADWQNESDICVFWK